MSGENVNKLYEAVKADNPENAEDIARRYEAAMASRNDQAKGRLEDLAATIIEAPKDEAYADTRKGMIDQFSLELDLVDTGVEQSEGKGWEAARELASALKLPFSVDAYGLTYRQLPEGMQIEPDKIEATFGALLKLAKGGDKVKAYMYEQSMEIGRLMGQYANGAFFEAEKTAQDLISRVENVQKLDSFIGKIGFGAIGLEEAELMRATFADNGVKLEDAAKIIAREKKANKDFGRLTLSPLDLAQLLVKVVIDSKTGKKGALVEVKINARIGEMNADLLKRLRDGKDKGETEMQIAINGAKYELAMALLTRDGEKMDEKFLDDVFKATTTDELRALYKAQRFADSVYLAKAEAAKTEVDFAQVSPDANSEQQLKQLGEIKSSIATKIAHEYKYFRSLALTSLSQVSDEMKPYVAARLEGFTQVLAQNRVVCGKLLGLNADYKLASGKDLLPSEQLEVLREDDKQTVDQIKEVVYFVGGNEAVKDFSADDIGVLAISPMQERIFARETEGFNGTFDVALKDAAQAYAKADDVPKMFERFNHNPESKEARDGKLIHVFEDGVRIYENLATQVSAARKNLLLLKTTITAQMNDPKFVPDNAELASARKKMYERALERVDMVLYSIQSPLNAEAVKSVIETRDKFEAEYKNWLEKEGYKIVAMAVVIASAVIGAMAVGALARAGAGKLFGTLNAAGRISSSVATFGTGTASLSGAALGATVSQRVGMYATDAIGISEFGKQGAISWGLEDLSTDFALNFGMSAAAVVVAKGLGAGIKIGSSSATRFPRFAAASVRVGKGIEAVKRFTSPLEGVGRSVSARVSSVLGRVGIRVGGEVSQEYVESGVEAVNPWAGFLVSVLNATDGIDVNLNHATSKLVGLGIRVQNGKLTNNFSTVEELTAALNSKFPKGGGYSVEVKAAENGGAWVSILGEGGQIDLDFYVERGAGGLDLNSRVAAIKGVEMVNGAPVVNAAKDMLPVLDGLTKQGYTVSMSEHGIVAKNLATGEEVTIQVEAQVLTEFATVLGEYMANLNGAAKELSEAITEMQSNPNPSPDAVLKFRLKMASFLLALAPSNAHANWFTDGFEDLTEASSSMIASGMNSVERVVFNFLGGMYNGVLFLMGSVVTLGFLASLVLGAFKIGPTWLQADFGVFRRLRDQLRGLTPGSDFSVARRGFDRAVRDLTRQGRGNNEVKKVLKSIQESLESRKKGEGKGRGVLRDSDAATAFDDLSTEIGNLITALGVTPQNPQQINQHVQDIYGLIGDIEDLPKSDLKSTIPFALFALWWTLRIFVVHKYEPIPAPLPTTSIGDIEVQTDDEDSEKSGGGSGSGTEVDPKYLPQDADEPGARKRRGPSPKQEPAPEQGVEPSGGAGGSAAKPGGGPETVPAKPRRKTVEELYNGN